MKKTLLIVANWKMYFSYQETVAWFIAHQHQLTNLLTTTCHELVICPSTITLSSVTQRITHSQLFFGGQNCSAHKRGAYTGEIDAESLREVGCTYCIVGHSERRAGCYETDEATAHQARQLLEQNITPIVCVGETEEEHTAQKTAVVIERQVTTIFKTLTQKPKHIIFAYEPVWAIGTGRIPTCAEIEEVFNTILSITTSYAPETEIRLLYGGSIDEHSIKIVQHADHLGGFLIGRASLDFQKLQKIVTCL